MNITSIATTPIRRSSNTRSVSQWFIVQIETDHSRIIIVMLSDGHPIRFKLLVSGRTSPTTAIGVIGDIPWRCTVLVVPKAVTLLR